MSRLPLWLLVSLVLHGLLLIGWGLGTLAGGVPAPTQQQSMTLRLTEQQVQERSIDPEPTPKPEPDPQPEPAPEPTPEPEPRPEPAPEPAPVTEPVPQLETTASIAPEGPGADQEGDEEDLLSRYRRELRDAIERQKEYPAQARLRGHEGTVVISFRVSERGRAEDIRIEESSGSRLLDISTERLLQRMRLPPPPEGIEPGTLNIPIDYLIE